MPGEGGGIRFQPAMGNTKTAGSWTQLLRAAAGPCAAMGAAASGQLAASARRDCLPKNLAMLSIHLTPSFSSGHDPTLLLRQQAL